MHLIEGGAALSELGAGSKTNTQWAFLSNLHAMGRETADRWLHEHRQDLGQRSTLDIVQALHGA